MKNSSKNLSILFLLIIFFAFGCSTTNQQDNIDELVVSQSGDPVTLDPHGTNDNRSNLLVVQIFDTLVWQDEALQIHPGLAEDWSQIDDRTYEFTLRQDVYFHNEEPLLASDVEFSLLRTASSATSSPILGQLDPSTIEVVDDYKIRVGTYEPFSPLLAHLAHPTASIVSEKAVATYGEQGFGQNPVGTGPFQFEQWILGDQVELSRNENYHGDLAGVEKLTIRNITETANRLIELETGQVDIALEIAPADISRAENHEHLTLIREPNLRTHYIGFNTQQEPFDDVRIRQAISYAVDIHLIIETILEGSGTPTIGPISPAVWGSHPNLEAYDYNPDRARELLEAAGLSDGFSTKILTDDDTLRMSIATALRSQLEAVGIQAEIETLDWATFLDATSSGEHQIFIMGWTTVTADADYGLYPLFHSSQFGSGGNRTFYDNDLVNQLLEAARMEQDEDSRVNYYLEVQELIVEEAPWIYLYIEEAVIGLANNINGFRANPTGNHYFSRVYFD